MNGLGVVQVVCTDAFAGVERYVTTLSAGLAARGCRVTVIGGEQARMVAALQPAGVQWLPGATLPTAFARLARLGRADVVHAHMTAAEMACVAAQPWHRSPVVATRHFAQARGSSIGGRLVGPIVARRLAREIAISDFVATTVGGHPVVVPPATPEPPQVAEVGEREPVVLVAQRLEVEKCTDRALEIWWRSGLAAEGWRLEVVGDGAERKALETQARALGISSSCTFFGSQADVGSFQDRAAVFLAPRPDEPFGLSVVEAMAHGLPVVAAAGGGHLETVGAVPGAALYSPEDLNLAARCLAEVAHDFDRRKTYAADSQSVHHELFSIERQISATLAIYQEVSR